MSDKLNLVVQFTAMDGLSEPLKRMMGLGKSAKSALGDLNKEAKGLKGEMASVAGEMRKSATASVEMMERYKGLEASIAGVNRRIEQQKRLMAIDGRTAKIQKQADAYKSQGMHGLMGAAVFLAPIGAAIHEARDYEREMARIDALGLGKGVVTHADRFARGAHIIGNSTRDMAHAYGDAMAIFKNTHEADFVAPLIGKMKFANQALYGEAEGEQHEQALMSLMKTIEFRGGTKSEASFQHQADFAQKVVNASRGRVDGNEMLNAMKTGGILAKTMSDKAFYLNSEPLVQEYGGNRFGTALSALYSNLAQGHGSIASQQELLRLGLLDRHKVQFNKMGMLKKTLPGASDVSVLRDDGALAYLQQVLLPAFAKKGIKGDNAIIEELGRIFSNKGASSLMTSVYQQREKLAMQGAANNQALGIDGSVKVASNTFAGKSVDLNAKWHTFLEVAAKKGGLLDMAIGGVEKLTAALDQLTAFANEHPTAFKWIGTAIVWLIGMRVAVAAAKLAFGGLLGPAAKVWGFLEKTQVFDRLLGSRAMGGLVKTLTKMPGLLGSVGRGALAFTDKLAGFAGEKIAKGVIFLSDKIVKFGSTLLSVGGSALRAFGTGVIWLGRLMWANPTVLIITAIVVALGLLAYYAYKHWDTISAAFSNAWGRIKSGFSSGIGWVKAEWIAFTTWLSGTALGKAVKWGSDIAAGAANGIKRFGGKAIDAAGNLADNVGGGFAQQLQIRSPSRVFMAFGGHIASGLAIGMDRSKHHPVHSMKRMAAAVAGAGALALAPAASARAPSAVRGGNHYEIHVHVGAGADGDAIAHAVEDAIRKLHRNERHSSYEDEM